MGLKESGLRGSLRNVSVGIRAIPDSDADHQYYLSAESGLSGSESITSITDQQGDNDLSGQGTFRESGQGQEDYVELDGTDDDFTGNRTHTGSTYTVALVIEMRDFSDRHNVIEDGGSGGGRGFRIYSNSSQEWEVIHDAQTVIGSASATADTVILVSRYDGSNYSLRENGNEILSGTPGYTSPEDSDDATIGAENDGTRNSPLDYYYSEHFSEHLSDSQTDDLESKLADVFDIAI